MLEIDQLNNEYERVWKNNLKDQYGLNSRWVDALVMFTKTKSKFLKKPTPNFENSKRAPRRCCHYHEWL